LNQPWEPGQNGFEFSSAELTRWMDRLELLKQAHDFQFHGRLPDPAPENPAALGPSRRS